MTRDEHRQVLHARCRRVRPRPRLRPNAVRAQRTRLHRDEPRAWRLHEHTRPRPPLRHDPRSAGRCSDRRAAVDQHASAAFCSPARPSVYDKVLNRECSFGLGFMTELRQHTFVGDRYSSRAFGHSGNVGTSFAFADPEHDLTVGVVFNGMVDYEAASLRRPRAREHALPGPRGSRCRWSRTGVGHRAECPPLFPYAPPPQALRPCAWGVMWRPPVRVGSGLAQQELRERAHANQEICRRALVGGALIAVTSAPVGAATSTDRVVEANIRDG